MLSELVSVPGGRFVMGSDRHYPEEAPSHGAEVAPFRIERYPVTNGQFEAFVRDTGYVTIAERSLDPAFYPGLSLEQRAAGSLVFTETAGPVDLRNWRLWWVWKAGADWRHPFGPQSNIQGRDDHPVVQVCFADASAYANWAGRRLPTEVEWERAARGTRNGAEFSWGDEFQPDGALMANTWQGSFPYRNNGAHGWRGTSPVGTFTANDFGLHDMIGNVWEWTSSTFTANHRRATQSPAGPPAAGLTTDAPRCSCGPADSPQPAAEPSPMVQRVAKGGSHLCAPEYCRRYRPAARSPQNEDSATTHLGFRCASEG